MVPRYGPPSTSQKKTYREGYHQDGPWDFYHDNGKLESKRTFKDGKMVGPWVGYHKNGKLQYKGTYKDGEKVGPWVFYYRDGTVDEKYTGTYKNGVKVK